MDHLWALVAVGNEVVWRGTRTATDRLDPCVEVGDPSLDCYGSRILSTFERVSGTWRVVNETKVVRRRNAAPARARFGCRSLRATIAERASAEIATPSVETIERDEDGRRRLLV